MHLQVVAARVTIRLVRRLWAMAWYTWREHVQHLVQQRTKIAQVCRTLLLLQTVHLLPVPVGNDLKTYISTIVTSCYFWRGMFVRIKQSHPIKNILQRIVRCRFYHD